MIQLQNAMRKVFTMTKPSLNASSPLSHRISLSSSSLFVNRNYDPKPQMRYMHVESRIKELGFDLPKVAIPARGTYRVVQRSGNILYLSGHIPQKKDGSLITGKI